MLPCNILLPGYNASATVSVARCVCKHFRRLPGQLLLLAALGALSASTLIAHGQTDKSLGDVSSATPHPEVCDGQNPVNQHNLSTKSGGIAAGEEQETAQSNSELTKKPLGLQGVADSAAAANQEGAQCKREHVDAEEQWKPKNSADGPDQPVFPRAEPTRPIVSYSGGELKVVGHGARLGQILEAIKALTGISLEVPPGSADSQIFDTVGPAPAREALVQLLDGTNFNYVILGSPDDPQRVQQLILTARTGMAPTNNPGPATGSLTEQASGPALYGAGFSTDGADQATAVEPVANTPPTPTGIPVNANIQQMATASGKTPGQILDELQKKQIQQLEQAAAQSAPQ